MWWPVLISGLLAQAVVFQPPRKTLCSWFTRQRLVS